MRWLSGWSVVVLSAVIALGGCGDDRGGDDLTLSFQAFTGDIGDQADAVGQNTADVDVCQDLCVGGSEEEIEVEPFTTTRVGAIFLNQGKADITLESYTVSIFRDLNGNGVRDEGEPGSGVPDMTYSLSTLIPGGRCIEDPSRQCAVDADCQSACLRQETTVSMLLYDFTVKDLVRDGDCPFDVVSQTYDAVITFRGRDDADNRYRITRAYNSTFDNFDNCEDQ